MEDVTIYSEMIGKTFVSVKGEVGGDELIFDDGTNWYRFSHIQDCCENVAINDICGDLQWLVGSPITEAESVESVAEEASESGTWTFYKFRTQKGFVTVRWLGESNGYYSESVCFDITPNPVNQ